MRQQSVLIQAIAITDEILLLLADRDFDRISELESKRQPLIRQAFAQSVRDIDSMKARHLASLNDQVVEKLNEFKQSVLQEQARIRAASKANRAYQSNIPMSS